METKKDENVEKILVLSGEDKLMVTFFLVAVACLTTSPMISSLSPIAAILIEVIGGICAVPCFLLIIRSYLPVKIMWLQKIARRFYGK